MLVLLGNAWLTYMLDINVLPDALTINGNGTWTAYATIGVVFTMINALLRPIIFLIASPLRWLTMGLFSFVLNAGLLWVSEFIINFLQMGGVTMSVNGIVYYFIVGAILAAFNSILHWFV